VVLKRAGRKKGELNLPLIYVPVAGCVFVFVYFLYNRLPPMPCVFKTITGYPCPTCGSTRLVVHLLRLDIISAFRSNPLVFLAGLVFLAWVGYGFYMAVSGRKIQVSLTNREGLVLRLGLAAAVVLNWLYLLLSGR